MPLRIAAHTVYQGITHLTLTGEADLATAEPLREAITRAVHGEYVAGVLIDLHAVRFLDSTTIGVLVAGRRLAEEKGVGCQVVNPEGSSGTCWRPPVSSTTYVATHQAERAERGARRAAG